MIKAVPHWSWNMNIAAEDFSAAVRQCGPAHNLNLGFLQHRHWMYYLPDWKKEHHDYTSRCVLINYTSRYVVVVNRRGGSFGSCPNSHYYFDNNTVGLIDLTNPTQQQRTAPSLSSKREITQLRVTVTAPALALLGSHTVDKTTAAEGSDDDYNNVDDDVDQERQVVHSPRYLKAPEATQIHHEYCLSHYTWIQGCLQGLDETSSKCWNYSQISSHFLAVAVTGIPQDDMRRFVRDHPDTVLPVEESQNHANFCCC